MGETGYKVVAVMFFGEREVGRFPTLEQAEWWAREMNEWSERSRQDHDSREERRPASRRISSGSPPRPAPRSAGFEGSVPGGGFGGQVHLNGRRSLRRRLAILCAAALFSTFGAAACGAGVEEQVEQQVQEGQEQVEQQVEKQVQEATQRIEQEAKEAQQGVEQEAQEVQKQIEEQVGGEQ